ncbi:DNA mismatch repair protein MSH3 [Yarrowia lipolytica]|nr:DNA mismatch repair protein MSH3 [Yarrowia lipolytica]RDW38341.1 DNA mismatch repair protein MSH3 [Yarrowia lipolytica]RDW45457.1 DNA mismatch repair protein MSH3 [Yarrowia lipolytica]RDW52077.1 DNA mismatch repair protein MSH3 [Yarrowia lipolytica]SEI35751.1 YALIA101S08e02630g1_1 [Yarrowia lipolytica]
MKRSKQATLSRFFKKPKTGADAVHTEAVIGKKPTDSGSPAEQKDAKSPQQVTDEPPLEPVTVTTDVVAMDTQPDLSIGSEINSKSRPKSLASFKSGKSINTDHNPELKQKFRAKLELVRNKNDEDLPVITKKTKLNATEFQWYEIKKQHRDTLLFVQVGYKYHIYGDDAEIAHAQTRLFLSPGITNLKDIGNDGVVQQGSKYIKLAYSSFPVHRIDFYTKQLVEKGFKVGHVQQMEVAALKNVENKKGPMIRELTNTFTKGTYIESGNGGSVNDVQYSSYLVALHESKGDKPTVTLLATEVSTGDVIWDSFNDDYVKSELEIRLLTLAPCEILNCGVSSSTLKMCQKYMHRNKGRLAEMNVLEEEVEDPDAQVALFFEGKANAGTCSTVLELPAMVKTLILATSRYLTHCKLDSLFLLTNNFTRYAGSYMRLSANTVASLELFANTTDHTAKGSLFWVLNRCLTVFGSRELKKWVSRPLTDRTAILQRLSAVEAIIKSIYGAESDELTTLINKLVKLLKPIPDLSKMLMRLHYGQLNRKEVYLLLRELLFVAQEFKPGSGDKYIDTNPVLGEIFNSLGIHVSDIEKLLEEINPDAARQDEALTFFVTDPPSLVDRKKDLKKVEAELQIELLALRAELNRPKLQYSSVAGIDYLIEVANKDTKKLPLEWTKISGTKSVSRFRTPTLNSLVKRHEYCVEKLKAACDIEFNMFRSRCATHYEFFRSMVVAMSQFDCLFALAKVSGQSGWVKADYVDEGGIDLKDSRHVITEKLMTNYISNDIKIRCPTVVTGPNMGGKSSLVRQIALSVLLAHIGCYVPASKAQIPITDSILCRMGAQDNIMSGQSTFMVELCECAEILRNATSKSLVLLDEIGRGTTTTDGIAIAHSVLKHFIELEALTLFITHYPLGQLLDSEDSNKCDLVHMDITNTNPPIFTYKMKPGSATDSYGLNVAGLAGIPQAIINRAEEMGKDMKHDVMYQEGVRMLTDIKKVM